MDVKRCFSPCKEERTRVDESAQADVLLSRRTMDTVVVFSTNASFSEFAAHALTKQGFRPTAVSSRLELEQVLSGGYLNYLVDCDGGDIERIGSTVSLIRRRAPYSHVLAHCPNPSWHERLQRAGVNSFVVGEGDLGLHLAESSTGFLENISALVSRQLTMTRRKIKDAVFLSRIERTTARLMKLSVMRLAQNDPNVRAFLSSAWPVSRHGQYVAIREGKTVGFAQSPRELAERVRHLVPAGNILIQKIDSESDSYRRYIARGGKA